MATRLVGVRLVVEREHEHGQKVEITADFSPEYGYQQWGATEAELWDNVALVTAVEKALRYEWPEEGEDEE